MGKSRYTSEEQILRAIDAAHQRIVDALAEAENLEDSARTLYRSGDEKLCESAELKKEEARKRRVTARGITERTLPRLANKLAVLRTPLLPCIGGDASVPVK